MKRLFKPGDTRQFVKTVKPDEIAHFDSGVVHPVYSTFCIAKDAEWACRLFVLEMKEDDEEGIGTLVSVVHRSPALVGSDVAITATVKSLERNEIICTFEVYVGERLVATGETGQKILPKEKIARLLDSLK